MAIAGQWAKAKAGQRTGCRSGVPWPAQALGVLAGIGCRRAPGLPPAWPVLAVLDHRQFGRGFALSIGEAGHKATTAPASSGAWWRSPASGPWRRRDSVPAADRGCRGLWSWCRGAGNPRLPPAWSVLAVLDHRQFFRAFVLSIGEAAHEATTAPASSGAWWRSPTSGPGRRREAHRRPIGRAMAWSGSRGAGNPRLPPAWTVLAVLDHRQFFRAFVLSIGEAGHEATTAPASSGAGWRSPASGARANAGQRTGCRSGLPLPGQALGVRAIRGCRWRGPCWQRSITGSSAGPSSSRSVKPATKRRQRQRRAVLGGDRRQGCQGERGTAQRLPIGRAVAWSGSRGAGNPRLPLAWPVLAALDHRQFGRAFVLSIGEAGHEATTAPASSGAWWRSPARVPRRTRDSATAADRSCRGLVRLSGCGQSAVAAGVARAGSARPSAVRSGLRSLDR
ncbi:MAG: hypothetical protein IPK44_10340 [Candidatus Accumulibacter sp.]|uniref:hypothetical protein n=1 Tax=Accumulibacter sp. TaxID=2053492 RepID=UPI002583ED99|nr:hypothetical protein [Accumulibacter sp.]MBK8114901.1 hypothetical protein [Accumulibacter sp.]